MATAIEKLIATARQEVGYLEKATNSNLDDKTANAGYNNYTKYARDLAQLGVYNGNKNGYAWCDVFADWCYIKTFGVDLAMKMTNQPMGGCGAGCTFSAGYYKSMGRFYTNNPQPGDQIFFKDSSGEYGHTGIIEKVNNGFVYTIEGNTSSASGVVANGGGVFQKSYPIGYVKIGGYGRPNWSLVEQFNDKIEEDEDMTQETFNKLMDNYIAQLSEQPATWDEPVMLWAQKEGLIVGDTKGNLMPKKFITRGELMTIVQRIMEKESK